MSLSSLQKVCHINMSEYLSCCEHLQVAIGENLHKHIRGGKSICLEIHIAQKGKQPMIRIKLCIHSGCLYFFCFVFRNWLTEPCLVVCKFLVALNYYFYEHRIKLYFFSLYLQIYKWAFNPNCGYCSCVKRRSCKVFWNHASKRCSRSI